MHVQQPDSRMHARSIMDRSPAAAARWNTSGDTDNRACVSSVMASFLTPHHVSLALLLRYYLSLPPATRHTHHALASFLLRHMHITPHTHQWSLLQLRDAVIRVYEDGYPTGCNKLTLLQYLVAAVRTTDTRAARGNAVRMHIACDTHDKHMSHPHACWHVMHVFDARWCMPCDGELPRVVCHGCTCIHVCAVSSTISIAQIRYAISLQVRYMRACTSHITQQQQQQQSSGHIECDTNGRRCHPDV